MLCIVLTTQAQCIVSGSVARVGLLHLLLAAHDDENLWVHSVIIQLHLRLRTYCTEHMTIVEGNLRILFEALDHRKAD